MPYPIGASSNQPARKYRDPTPYWEAVSTSTVPPWSTSLTGPRKKSWWNWITGLVNAPKGESDPKMTKSGMASTQRTMIKASIATPQRRGTGGKPVPPRAYTKSVAGTATAPSATGSGLIDPKEVKARSAPRTSAHANAQARGVRWVTPRTRAHGRVRVARASRAIAPSHQTPTTLSASTTPPAPGSTRTTRIAAASVATTNATRRESAPALGPAAMVSARRDAAIRAAGRMIAKATRYRALSTSCSWSLRGGGSGVGLVRINAGPRTSTKSPIASATVSATVGPRGARGPMRCSDAAGA